MASKFALIRGNSWKFVGLNLFLFELKSFDAQFFFFLPG